LSQAWSAYLAKRPSGAHLTAQHLCPSWLSLSQGADLLRESVQGFRSWKAPFSAWRRSQASQQLFSAAMRACLLCAAQSDRFLCWVASCGGLASCSQSGCPSAAKNCQVLKFRRQSCMQGARPLSSFVCVLPAWPSCRMSVLRVAFSD